MLDSFDNTMPVEAASAVSFDELSSQYDALLSFYSVRTNNVLQALEGTYPGKWLARSLREYQYHKDSMSDSKRESIEHIISFISGNEQCTR